MEALFDPAAGKESCELEDPGENKYNVTMQHHQDDTTENKETRLTWRGYGCSSL